MSEESCGTCFTCQSCVTCQSYGGVPVKPIVQNPAQSQDINVTDEVLKSIIRDAVREGIREGLKEILIELGITYERKRKLENVG